MSVSCPTFFLHGGKDETISVDNTRELASIYLYLFRTMLSEKPGAYCAGDDPFDIRFL